MLRSGNFAGFLLAERSFHFHNLTGYYNKARDIGPLQNNLSSTLAESQPQIINDGNT